MTRTSKNKKQEFGGSWTEQKLNVLQKYLAAYTKALQGKGFSLHYIDAFAGTGYRDLKTEDGAQALFPELEEKETREFLDGSATIALKVQPHFDGFVFIEKSTERCKQLEIIQTQHPGSKIGIRNEDANTYLGKVTRGNWSKNRAVLFLDPFGLQVKWKTLEAVAATQAIDVWILFPLGSGVNRLLQRDGNIDPRHKKVLDEFFGNEDWFREFYKTDDEPDLFGGTQPTHTKCDLESVGKYFLKRLKMIFPYVATPLPLKNSKQNPIFLFCFAAANKGKGGALAVKIANDIVLRELRRG